MPELTEAQLGVVQSVFTQASRDERTCLNQKELTLCFRLLGNNPTDDDIISILKDYKNEDGSGGELDQDTVQKILEANLKSMNEERDAIKEAICSINEDPEDEYITKSRLVEVLTTRGAAALSEKEVEGLVKNAGVDEEGRIRVDDLVNIFLNGAGRRYSRRLSAVSPVAVASASGEGQPEEVVPEAAEETAEEPPAEGSAEEPATEEAPVEPQPAEEAGEEAAAEPAAAEGEAEEAAPAETPAEEPAAEAPAEEQATEEAPAEQAEEAPPADEPPSEEPAPEEAPATEEAPAEEPAAEEAPAEEPAAEAPAEEPAAEEAPAEEPAAEEAPAEEAPAEETPAAEEASAEEPAAEAPAEETPAEEAPAE